MFVCGESRMNEEFKFKINGTHRLLTFIEIDALLKGMMQEEIDAIENRLIEVYDRRVDHPSTGITSDHYGKTDTMKLGDVLIKFR